MKKIQIFISITSFILGTSLGLFLGYLINHTNSSNNAQTIETLGSESTKNPNYSPSGETYTIVPDENPNQEAELQTISVAMLEKTSGGYIATSDDTNRITILVSEDTEVLGEFDESAAKIYATVECEELTSTTCRAKLILFSPVG